MVATGAIEPEPVCGYENSVEPSLRDDAQLSFGGQRACVASRKPPVSPLSEM